MDRSIVPFALLTFVLFTCPLRAEAADDRAAAKVWNDRAASAAQAMPATDKYRDVALKMAAALYSDMGDAEAARKIASSLGPEFAARTETFILFEQFEKDPQGVLKNVLALPEGMLARWG